MKGIYLITGATGFVGACLTYKLVKLGKTVHVFSRKKQPNWRLNGIKNAIHFHTIDLQDNNLTNLMLKINPTYIFHLAAYGSLPQEDNLQKMISTNILGTINLINASKQSNVKLIINTSSSAEYASKDSAFKETDTLGPMNDYAVSKVAQTLYCQKEALRNNIPIITFRLFSTFGYLEEKTRLIPHTILHALKNEDIPLSNKHFVRDLIFIEDVIDAYIKASIQIPKPGEIFNIGTGKQFTIEQVVNQIIKISKSKSSPLWGSIQKQDRQIEPKVWKANREKAYIAFDWKPNNSMKVSLTKTIDWFKKNKNLYA
jgi:nucleoside-diphosphate-sugar epimerase